MSRRRTRRLASSYSACENVVDAITSTGLSSTAQRTTLPRSRAPGGVRGERLRVSLPYGNEVSSAVERPLSQLSPKVLNLGI